MEKDDHQALVSRTPETAPFWAAAEEGRLVLPRCDDCGRYHWFPRAQCPHCRKAAISWVVARGSGTVHSFTHMRKAAEPHVAAIVTLDEGVSMLTRIVDASPDDVRIGQKVRARFADVGGVKNACVFAPWDDGG